MADGLYDDFKEKQIDGNAVNFSGEDIRITLVDAADYVVNLTTHDFYDDVAAAGRVAEMGAGMTSKTFTDGTFDAADVTYTAVSGDPSEGFVLYSHTGASDADRALIGYFDSWTGLPVTPSGGDITITFNGSGIISW